MQKYGLPRKRNLSGEFFWCEKITKKIDTKIEVMSGKVSTDELSEGALANGDVARNDGKITLEDVMTLLYYLSGRITSFES